MGHLQRTTARLIRPTLATALCGWFLAAAVPAGAGDLPAHLGVGATFDTLQVGQTVYRHVQIRSVSAHSLMISHAGGLVSLPLRELPPEWQAALGYDPGADAAAPPPPEAKRPAASAPKPARKGAGAATASFDAILQSFGQPPEIRPVVDLRPKLLELALNVKNQGPRPSCAVFAIVSALEFQNAQLTGQAERFSEEYLVWATLKSLHRTSRLRPTADTGEAENLDSVDEGFALSEVVTALRTYGIPLQSSLPYSFATTPAADPPAEVVDEARNHRRVSVFALPGRDQPTRIGNLIQALNAGVPVAVGLRWPLSRTLHSGYLNTQKPLEGNGHAVAIVGYENKTGVAADTVFVFKNSWGVKWGASGFGYVTYAYLNDNLVDTALLEVDPAGTTKAPHG